MGQWWFLYDKYACRVVNRYPVFSFHQDGIAPAGLFALEEAIGQSFQKSISKGLSWISGANELAYDLRDSSRGLIWDSIRPRRDLAKYWEAALSFMGVTRDTAAGASETFDMRPGPTISAGYSMRLVSSVFRDRTRAAAAPKLY